MNLCGWLAIGNMGIGVMDTTSGAANSFAHMRANIIIAITGIIKMFGR